MYTERRRGIQYLSLYCIITDKAKNKLFYETDDIDWWLIHEVNELAEME